MTTARFLRALARQPVDRTPIWIMRQAGRYLPEYRATRARAGDFLTLCKTPELACEVTLQPLARFPLDAAILFSDILTVPDAMGLGLAIDEGSGPRFARPLAGAADIAQLPLPDPCDDLGYVLETIRLVKRALDPGVPLIGFAGSPWTLATYMVEGRATRDFTVVKKLVYARPDAAHALLDKLARAVADCLVAQIEAGVDAVMLFDTWGGVLPPAAYLAYSLAYMRRIVAALPPATPSILFTRGGGQWLEPLADSGCSALGLDWTVDLASARARVGARVALQGNLDPAVMLTDPGVIADAARALIDAWGPGSGHVFNLGHGILPDTPPEHVAALVETVHEHSRRYHGDA
jgi:uroporphyrinogen decarboxylase